MKSTSRQRQFDLRSIWCSIFILLNLQTVCAVCPSGCVCDDETLYVNCVDANLDFVPITLNPLVQKLLLRNNRIRSVETGFGFYHELNFIDLSRNHLLRIAPGSFANQPKLTELHLNNNKISALSNYTFGNGGGAYGSGTGFTSNRGLSSLIHLNLRNNLLENIEPGIFTYTKALQELDLGQNTLRELVFGVFEGLEALRILRLDHNDFRVIPDIFGIQEEDLHDNLNGPLSHLAELSLGMNPLESLEAAAFARLGSLTVLDLKGCQLGLIHTDAFSGLGQLKKLILTDNLLKSVPSWAFGPVGYLEILKIGRNPITALTGSSFRPLTRLKVLEVNGAQALLTVAEETFHFNLDLEIVEISNAKLLTILPPKLFNGISSLRSLILKDNAFKSLPEDLASWQSLSLLQLQGNPFSCSCDLSWLRDLLVMSTFRNASFLILCDEPQTLKDRRVIDLTNKELNCLVPSPWQQILLGVILSVVIIFLIVFFYLLYRFHDKIKSSWKNHRGRGQRVNGSAVAVKVAEMDTSTKSSFLSHHPAYPYSDEEFALRTSLMTTPQAQAYYAHSLNPSTLQRQYGNHGYPPTFQNSGHAGHPNGTFCPYGEPDYETPLSLGLTMFSVPNSNPIHHYTAPGQTDNHYGLQIQKPVPITEL